MSLQAAAAPADNCSTRAPVDASLSKDSDDDGGGDLSSEWTEADYSPNEVGIGVTESI